MGFVKFVGGVAAVFVAFVIAMKILGIVFGLLKLAIMVGVIALICYGVYRLVSSGEQKAPSE